MTPNEQKRAAKDFVARWKAAEGNEQRESNSFWIELCMNVLGIANPTQHLDFERKVKENSSASNKGFDVFSPIIVYKRQKFGQQLSFAARPLQDWLYLASLQYAPLSERIRTIISICGAMIDTVAIGSTASTGESVKYDFLMATQGRTL